MIRLPRPALAIFAGLVVVFASACGSSAATPGAGGTTGPAGVSAAPAGASAAVNPNDPNSIITQVLSSGQSTTSFHIKIEVSGTIKAAALNSAAGSAGSGPTSDVKLDGTAIEGDVDVANQAAHLSLTVAPIATLGNVPITGDLILKDSALYYKVSLLGPKYTKTDLGSLTSLSPVAVPTPGASALAGVADQIAQLRQQLDAAGVKATLVGVEQIGNKDAYHISLSVPLDKLNAEIASAAASAAPGMKIDSASVDIWTYKDTYQLAKIQIAGASSS
ncbi:MAG TPA: hypothetical protein VF371_06135, partial [Candidatus Limnocylindrales bacterium]